MSADALTNYSDPRDLLYKNGSFVVFYPPRFLVRVSPLHFVGWVQNQGISISPEDSNKILEYAVLGTENPYEDLINSYYQKALKRRASRAGQSVDELVMSLEVVYDKYKDNLIEHTDLPLGGWELWAAAHTDKLILDGGLTPSDSVWYDLKAFDVLVILTGRLISDGTPVQELEPSKILTTALKNTTTLHELYQERYAGYMRTPDEVREGPMRMKAGIARLAQTFGSREGRALQKKFISLAQNMYADLHDQDRAPLGGLVEDSPILSLKSLEAVLPRVFFPAEIKSLLNFFNTTPGPEIVRGYRVVLHCMARLFSSLNEPDQLALGVQLSNRQLGLAAFQKCCFEQAVCRFRNFGQTDNVVSLVIQALGVAAHHGGAGVGDKSWAIFRLAGFLGEMDAVWTAGLHPKEPVDVLWELAPTYHQRTGQSGLSLADQLIQSDLRAALLIPSSTLGLPDTHYAKTSVGSSSESDLTELYPGCKIIGLGVVSLPNGYTLKVSDGPGDMTIYDADGKVVATRTKDFLSGKTVLERKAELFDWALRTIHQHKKSPNKSSLLFFDELSDAATLELVDRISNKLSDLNLVAKPMHGLMGRSYRIEKHGKVLFDLAFSSRTGLVVVYHEPHGVVVEAATEELIDTLLPSSA